MNTLYLNIGMNITDSDTPLERHQITLAVEDILPNASIRKAYFRTADTGELTACLQIDTTLAYAELGTAINALCAALQQEAIAGKFAAKGHPLHQFLIGPKAEAWGGEFLDEYWLPVLPENTPIDADDALGRNFE